MPNGTAYVTLRKGNRIVDFPAENLAKAKALGWMEVKDEKGKPAEHSLWEEANRPLGKDVNKIIQEKNQKMSDWIALHVPPSIAGPATQIARAPLDIAGAIDESGRRTMTPLGVGTLGTGALLEQLRALPGISNLFKMATGAAETVVGAGFGAAGAQQAISKGPKDESTMDAIERRLGGLGQAIMGLGVPIAHVAGPTVKAVASEAPRTALREVSNVNEQTLNAKAEEVGKERTAEIDKANAARKKSELAKQKVEQSNAKIEETKKVLTQKNQQLGQEFTKKFDDTVKYIKASYDSEYGDFDSRVLGKTPQNPKGTLVSNLSRFAGEVEHAKSLLEGSQEKISQFEAVLHEAEKQGQLAGLTPKQTGGSEKQAVMSTVDLRGIITELQAKIYGREILPDVRKALEHVVEKGKEQVLEEVGDQAGKQSAAYLEDLNKRYSKMLSDWRDPSKVNPLPYLRNILFERTVSNDPGTLGTVNLAKKITPDKLQTALYKLAQYKNFQVPGVKLDEILKNYRQTLEQLKSLEKTKTVPEAKPLKDVKTEPFNREQYIKEKVGERMTNVGNWGSGFMLIRALSDAARGKFGRAADTAMEIALMQILKRGLTQDKVLDWVSKEKQ